MNSEFSAYLKALEETGEARMERVADGHCYPRLFLARERLILLGGGHVSQALARLAANLDFSITEVDDRPSFANGELFPQADVIICDSFQNALRERISVTPRDYICILTRGHRWDGECLRAILDGNAMPRYLGMIGSRQRVAGMLEEMKAEGFPEERLRQLHAPIGLPIRAVTPDEIAVSILAEMVSVRRAEKPAEDTMYQTEADMALLRDLAEAEEPRVMCMVLGSDGPTPASPGALMTVGPAGRLFGTVGGGCGEAAVLSRARKLLGTGRSEVLNLDMVAETQEEEAMVCGGIMSVLIEDLVVQK